MSHRKLDYQDYLRFPDEGNRHELLDGEHVVTPAPSTRHQTASMNLSYFFVDHLRRNPQGFVFAAPTDVIFSDHDVAEPDLLFVSKERAGIVTEKNVQGAPDLVVEIVSPSTRRSDEIVKRRLYERFGVREYWLVLPRRRAVRVFRHDGARFRPAEDLSARDVLTTPLLPGLAIPVGEVFG
jgi:Uma2 family endonuclease